jgi:hypothetical protein
MRSIENVCSHRLRGKLLATQAVMMGQFASNLGGAKPAKTNGPLPNGPTLRHSALSLHESSHNRDTRIPLLRSACFVVTGQHLVAVLFFGLVIPLATQGPTL